MLPVHAAGALLDALADSAPRANRDVLRLALEATRCAARGKATPSRLAVIDYSRRSSEPRLWVFDLERPRLLYEELVAHGSRSGDDRAVAFSNRPGSLQSSLGLYRTADTYVGRHGYSLRLEGLEPGINDRARERAIVMHGASYVSRVTARRLGRLGHSWGCPAVRREIAYALIDGIKGGAYLFSYYPDDAWLRTSAFLNCASLSLS